MGLWVAVRGSAHAEDDVSFGPRGSDLSERVGPPWYLGMDRPPHRDLQAQCSCVAYGGSGVSLLIYREIPIPLLA